MTIAFGFVKLPVVLGVTDILIEKLPVVPPIVTEPPLAVQVTKALASIEQLIVPVIPVEDTMERVAGSVP